MGTTTCAVPSALRSATSGDAYTELLTSAVHRSAKSTGHAETGSALDATSSGDALPGATLSRLASRSWNFTDGTSSSRAMALLSGSASVGASNVAMHVVGSHSRVARRPMSGARNCHSLGHSLGEGDRRLSDEASLSI